MKVDINFHESKCVQCAQHKGTVPKPAPILQYPTHEATWDVVAIDLLQLSKSNEGSRYLVCVDHFFFLDLRCYHHYKIKLQKPLRVFS